MLFKKVYNWICLKDENKELDIYVLKDQQIKNKGRLNFITNISDNYSRYLLLEIKPSLAPLIHCTIQKNIKDKKTIFYESSPFLNDENIEYKCKKIKSIQDSCANGNIAILQNLDSIYPYCMIYLI